MLAELSRIDTTERSPARQKARTEALFGVWREMQASSGGVFHFLQLPDGIRIGEQGPWCTHDEFHPVGEVHLFVPTYGLPSLDCPQSDDARAIRAIWVGLDAEEIMQAPAESACATNTRLEWDVPQEGLAKTPDERPIWEVAAEISASIDPESWKDIPTDLYENLDHYLYGTPKEDE